MTGHNRGSAVIIVVIIALALLCSIAGVAVFVLRPHTGKSSSGKGPTSLVPIGEVVVNLADSNQTRYLKTDLVLEVSGSFGESEENEAKAKVRDAVIGVLSSKHYGELIQPDGKTVLKKQILSAVNRRLDGAKATDVFFNEFAMQ